MKTDNQLSTFCLRCGRDVLIDDPSELHIPMLCTSCHEDADMEFLWKQKSKSPNEGAIGGSRHSTYFYVVTYVGDLGNPKQPNHVSRWSERAFSALCVDKISKFPATRWKFGNEMLPAVESILKAIKRPLVFH